MKIYSLATKKTYDIDFTKSGENAMPCPECPRTRGNEKKKPFSFNVSKGAGYCQHCEARFVEYKPFVPKKEYIMPKAKNTTQLSDKAVAWFAGRSISQKTLTAMGIYSDAEYMPQISKETTVICFPFYFGESLVNIKYRDRAKNFKLCKDAELIMYNINSLADSKEIVITEGEIDCLSYIESGIINCMSVPNGAGKNLDYLDNYIDLFKGVDKIYIATDNDIKGIELKLELIKRFGQERCAIVQFKECKDANEYLQAYGRTELAETIKNAKDVQVEGIVDVDDMYDQTYALYMTGPVPGMGIGVSEIDRMITWETGRVCVVTGIPGHGKSELVDYIVTRLNILHGWKTAFFSPENYPVQYHIAKLIEKLSGKRMKAGEMDEAEFVEAYDYMKKNNFWIYPEDDMTFDNILDKAKVLVRQRGITTLVFDPFNKIEHLIKNGESETVYIGRFLDKCAIFAKRHNVLVFIVAHPTKMKKTAAGVYEVPTLYDINGSSNWFNKCDYGISVYRDYANCTTTMIAQKVKFRHLGSGGETKLMFNLRNGRYVAEGIPIDKWDNRSYLAKAEESSQLMPSSIFEPENLEYELTTVTTEYGDDPPF